MQHLSSDHHCQLTTIINIVTSNLFKDFVAPSGCSTARDAPLSEQRGQLFSNSLCFVCSNPFSPRGVFSSIVKARLYRIVWLFDLGSTNGVTVTAASTGAQRPISARAADGGHEPSQREVSARSALLPALSTGAAVFAGLAWLRGLRRR